MPEQPPESTFRRPENSFALMPDLQKRYPRISARWLPLWRLHYRLKAAWRWLRVRRFMTALLGAQYRRSRDLIEIDITYLCNLHCLNCNRSVTHAREALHMAVATVSRFVDESIARDKRWRRIRVLGGEPTLHPEFNAILDELLRYKRSFPAVLVEMVTNGHGKKVNRVLSELPPEVLVDNSEKGGPVQPHFGPFNLAPQDDPAFESADFSNGCAILQDCGMGLTPTGYYPCAVAGGIDRITGEGLGRDALPADDDDMLSEADRFCRMCGRFRAGHFVPRLLRPALEGAPVSPSWKVAYVGWEKRRYARESESEAS